jgi:hypothetical protein
MTHSHRYCGSVCRPGWPGPQRVARRVRAHRTLAVATRDVYLRIESQRFVGCEITDGDAETDRAWTTVGP